MPRGRPMDSPHRRHREVVDPQRDDANLSEAELAGKDGPSAFSMEDDEMWLHNHGVLALTLRLARAVGMKEDELINARRGAFLDDSETMCVPGETIYNAVHRTEK